jgi:transcriptional regulator with XRE-family HTH domain
MDSATLQKRLGSAVRAQREALGHSQESFADAIAMHRAYYSAIERGERNVTLTTLGRITAGLGITIWALMKEAGL